MLPEKIGRYEIVRELGRGAMGVVYEARDPNIGRLVALKTVRAEWLASIPDDATRRFGNEARAAGRLNHPNIVTVYDAGSDAGVLYLAMELIEGRSIEALLRDQRVMPPVRATDIIRQVLTGLSFAHSRQVIHRDIKPGNIMVTGQGVVKITDFGIAHVGTPMTLTGQVVGTPHYMAPEQLLGKTVDARTDLFSVGVMMYEMITGERPFDGQSIATVMYKIVHEQPIPPRRLDPSIHPSLSAMVEKSLAKAPDARFQNAAEFIGALQSYDAGAARDPMGSAATMDVPIFQPGRDAPTQEVPVYSSGQPPVQEAPGKAAPSAQPAPSSARRQRRWPLYLTAFALLCVAGALITQRALRTGSGTTGEAPNREAPAASPAVPAAPGPAATAMPQPETQSGASPVMQKRGPKAGEDTASVNVDSDPPGAQVLVDGVPTGKRSPAEVELSRGKHTVSAMLEGLPPAYATFHIEGGEEFDFSPSLIPAAGIPDIAKPDLSNLKELENGADQARFWQEFGKTVPSNAPQLVVSTQPEGAVISLDGQVTGKRSPSVIPLSPGTYRISLTLDGYKPVERKVKINQRKTAVVNVKLSPVKNH